MNRQQITRDYQSVGALLVNNLVAKLGEFLFPASARFVKLKLNKVSDQQRQSMSQVNQALITIEKAIVDKAKENGGYADLLQAIAQQAVTGNAALYRDMETGSYRVYGLESFVVQRDGRGVVVDAIVKERIQWDSLPKDFQNELNSKGFRCGGNKRVWLYTRVLRVQKNSGTDGHENTPQSGNYPGCVSTPGQE